MFRVQGLGLVVGFRVWGFVSLARTQMGSFLN